MVSRSQTYHRQRINPLIISDNWTGGAVDPSKADCNCLRSKVAYSPLWSCLIVPIVHQKTPSHVRHQRLYLSSVSARTVCLARRVHRDRTHVYVRCRLFLRLKNTASVCFPPFDHETV